MTPNCHEPTCDRAPEFEVFWPGKVPPPRYCFQHTQVARSILWTLGCDVEVRPIIVRDEASAWKRPAAWWGRFREWRFNRTVSKFVYESNDAMLDLAAQRLGRALTAAEREDLPRLYGRWLIESDAKLDMLLDRPVRTIHLFLSELWP